MVNFVKKYVAVLLGTLLFALSVNVFLVPSKIVTGGLSGIATILHYKFGISIGFAVMSGNILLCIIAYVTLGRKFVLDSILGILSITVFVSFTEFLPSLTDDLFLNSVFGGILMGIGIGLTFIQGATTGGTDIISRISQKRHPELSIGFIMTVVDLIIIGASAIVFGDIALSMYGIISLVVSTAVIDGIIASKNSGVLVFVVTENENEIKNLICRYLNRGVTVIDVFGGYSDRKRKLIMCVMKTKEAEELKKTEELRKNGNFMIVTPSKEVLGEGFRYYR